MTSPPVTARRAQTRDRLIEAAVHVFAERGVLGSSVEEICERAGFTRGAFYSNFDSKDELCLALIRHHCEVQIEAVRDLLASIDDTMPTSDLDELLQQALGHFMFLHGKDRDTAVALAELQLYAVRNPDFAVTYNEVDLTIDELFAEIVEDALSGRGLRFVIPSRDVISIIKGVFTQNAMSTLRGGGNQAAQIDQLASMLRSLISPTCAR